jgi:hypothetical protein
MQFGESPSGTGDDGLHAPFYNRTATPLKSKVWLYCIKSCHAAHRRGSPMGRVAQIVWETAEHGWLNRSTFDNPKTRGISCILLAILAAAGWTPALRSVWAIRPPGRLPFPIGAIPQPRFTHFWQRQCNYWLGFKSLLNQHRFHKTLCDGVIHGK